MSAYYNEIDPDLAVWTRNLIAAGHITPGDVDERSIEDVCADDLRGYTQCHFFAGLGGWSLALRSAGWSDDRAVWTGSCPCQPFSAAGKGGGFDDERHLWPSFEWLIRQCKPPVILGEQVASKAVDDWIDLVHADMEALGYAFGSVPFPSAGVGAPHIRDRNYWVADATQRSHRAFDGESEQGVRQQESIGGYGLPRGLAHAADFRLDGRRSGSTSNGSDTARIESERLRDAGRLDHADGSGLERHSGNDSAAGWKRSIGSVAAPGVSRDSGPTNGFWGDADWLLCRDGKWRAVEPGTFPLVDGVSARVGRVRAEQANDKSVRKHQGHRVIRLKGYGNAINVRAATTFIESVVSI